MFSPPKDGFFVVPSCGDVIEASSYSILKGLAMLSLLLLSSNRSVTAKKINLSPLIESRGLRKIRIKYGVPGIPTFAPLDNAGCYSVDALTTASRTLSTDFSRAISALPQICISSITSRWFAFLAAAWISA